MKALIERLQAAVESFPVTDHDPRYLYLESLLALSVVKRRMNLMHIAMKQADIWDQFTEKHFEDRPDEWFE